MCTTYMYFSLLTRKPTPFAIKMFEAKALDYLSCNGNAGF